MAEISRASFVSLLHWGELRLLFSVLIAPTGLWLDYVMKIAVELAVKSFASVNNGKEFSLCVGEKRKMTHQSLQISVEFLVFFIDPATYFFQEQEL